MVWLEIFNFLHFIGLAFGVGGATIATMISIKSEKDKELNQQVMKIILPISKLIWFGFFLLVVSGIGISFFVKWPINENLLILKHVLVFWILIIGIIIGVKIKKMQYLAPKPNQKPTLEFLKTKKQITLFGKISLILWYAIVALSVFI